MLLFWSSHVLLKTLFSLRSLRNPAFCIFLLIIHFPQVPLWSTDESGCSKMVSMSRLIGGRLKFQRDQSPSLKEGLRENVKRLDTQEAMKRRTRGKDVNDSLLFPQTVLFDIFTTLAPFLCVTHEFGEIITLNVFVAERFFFFFFSFGEVLITLHKSYYLWGGFVSATKLMKCAVSGKQCVCILNRGR